MIGREFWDIKPLWELKPPRARKEIVCPICGSHIFYFKHARIFKRYPDTVGAPRWQREQFRIDIAIKCDGCGFVPFFGVHITPQEYEDLRAVFISNKITNLMLEYQHTGIWMVSPEYRKLRELR